MFFLLEPACSAFMFFQFSFWGRGTEVLKREGLDILKREGLGCASFHRNIQSSSTYPSSTLKHPKKPPLRLLSAWYAMHVLTSFLSSRFPVCFVFRLLLLVFSFSPKAFLHAPFCPFSFRADHDSIPRWLNYGRRSVLR